MISEVDVAKWMLATLTAQRSLYQDAAVHQIEQEFGAAFVYDNASGNRAISKLVLKEFDDLDPDNVVWQRAEKAWRFREPYDPQGRQVE